ncbi:MAG: phosphate ABC transporter substrate-binding protein [Solirubrobacterales bacterium]
MLSLTLPVAASAKTITMSGSTSVYPLAVKLAKAYNKKTKGKTKFKIAQGGSDIGIEDSARGRVVLGNASRDPQAGDPGGIVFNKIARDALCVATNKSNALANLSQAQIEAIFAGQIKRWNDVPGAQVTGPINLYVRTPASGTQDAFREIFMGNTSVTGSASQKASNGVVQQSIKSDPNGIGYVSIAFTKGIAATPYNGVACTLRNAKSGRYGGSRNFWMVSRGKAKGDAKKFLKWARKDKKARKIVNSEWVAL